MKMEQRRRRDARRRFLRRSGRCSWVLRRAAATADELSVCKRKIKTLQKEHYSGVEILKMLKIFHLFPGFNWPIVPS